MPLRLSPWWAVRPMLVRTMSGVNFGPCGYAWTDDRTRMEGASPHHVCAESGDHAAHRCACGVIFGGEQP